MRLIVATSAAALTEMWGEVQRAAGAMERLAELLAAHARRSRRRRSRCRCRRVRAAASASSTSSFRYPSRPESWRSSDCTLDDAQRRDGRDRRALRAPARARRFQLLLRFYDPASGAASASMGMTSRSLDPLELRQQIGLVPQDTVLFGASARENIGYGRPGASAAQIEAAARAAAADEFMRELPAGYDTFLGERGTRLSGGQRQRIAIARAILKDPPILLLDEATSALDAESERLVQPALGRADARSHHAGDRASARDGAEGRPHRGARGGTRGRDRHPRASCCTTSPLYARLAALQFASVEAPGDAGAVAIEALQRATAD